MRSISPYVGDDEIGRVIHDLLCPDGKRETVEMLLRKKLLTPDQIAENLDFLLSEVLEIEKSIG